MSPRIFSCVLCGYLIYDYEDPDSASWINQFRILYTSRNGIAVTGVGFYNDPDAGDWIAPPDFNARWDDAGYNFSASDCVGVLRQRPVNGRYGFPFHEACWSLLDVVYSPDPIPCRALFEVCRSLPSPSEGTGLSWGHSFGDLVVVNNQDHYPWDDRFVNRDGDSAQCKVARHDPRHVPEIPLLLLKAPKTPEFTSVAQPRTIVPNCFTALALEICIEIASYLPTVDALSARGASRSFMPIFYSNRFWASRFMADADRSWLFESQKWDKTSDWRWLYHRTNKVHRDGGIQNRERVYKLIQQVQRTLHLRWNEPSVLTSLRPIPATLRWLEATGDLRQESRTGPYHGFSEGCRLFHERQISVPSQLDQIAFSVVRLGDVEYIAGMRLISKNGAAVELGYSTESKESVLNITLLEGFNLAVGSRGIQGIQCKLGGGLISPWFGCTCDAPQPKRLEVSGPTAAIKAGFDGLKMVSLAIAERTPPGAENKIIERSSLRDFAFWYPQIPGNDLYLNDECFTARGTSTTRYQPLCWTMFGGPRGSYLRHLTKISVTSLGTLRDIEFHFNTDDIPAKSRKLGRCKLSEYSKVMHFDIDGPGGEFINAVEVYVRFFAGENVLWFYKEGQLESFKVWTNRGRSYHFREKKGVAHPDFVKKPITVASGSIITGFYWSQHENSLTSLGAISEKIEIPIKM